MVQKVLSLERFILQGNYKAFFSHTEEDEFPYFDQFRNRFYMAITTERARSIELSYEQLELGTLASLLQMDYDSARGFIQKRN